ncbi:MAG: NADPH:quinone reductase [Emcibacter sp.]|nr:NADPH:quinone reductase [Emcibacter sp.]
MKAIWYDTTGKADAVLVYGDMAKPEPAEGEVLVRLYASGVNPSDVKARAGARGPLAYDRAIPHSDGAGIIEAVGEAVAPGRIGERVWIWNGAWGRAFGTCGEYMTVATEQAVPLPDNVSFDEGACLGIPATTAYYGMFSDGKVASKTVLVTGGAGAVGHYAIQFAKLGGARVITTVSGPEKAAHAKSAGPDVIINYREGDVAAAIMAATDGEGVDRIIEVEFGGNLEISNKVLRPNGVIAAYGSMAKTEPALPFYPMLFNGVTLRLYLVYLLSDEDRLKTIEGLNKMIAGGHVKHAVTQTFSLENTASAHKAVESGKIIGNVIVRIE